MRGFTLGIVSLLVSLALAADSASSKGTARSSAKSTKVTATATIGGTHTPQTTPVATFPGRLSTTQTRLISADKTLAPTEHATFAFTFPDRYSIVSAQGLFVGPDTAPASANGTIGIPHCLKHGVGCSRHVYGGAWPLGRTGSAGRMFLSVSRLSRLIS